MRYQDIIKSTLANKRNTNMATVAIIGGVAVGLALGALFATKKGKSAQKQLTNFLAKVAGRKSEKNAHQKLSSVISDVRSHVKQNAEGLLSAKQQTNAPAEIKLENVTNNWKKPQEHQLFPNEPSRS
ncbi:YtxH domain-containing protein [Pedobacter cryotolerans]|uniref:YtxH domain-containing protein n=1 Tax=Pedobacter cryotolerans TaxID=2571270 RepID=A0A4U1CA01_9SPHI|nr:YtxH domain-containing protein [Pedobacter cryotolerans]TKC02615.1 YtxH domain-containing protein [Pedobacter cryotolerans]